MKKLLILLCLTVAATLHGAELSKNLTVENLTATGSISLKGYTLDTFAASLMTATNSADMAGKLGLGGAALLNVGTTAGTVAAGNDSRIVNAVQQDAQGGVFVGGALESYGPIVASGGGYFRIYNNDVGVDSAADWSLSCLTGGYLSHDASLRLTALNNLGGTSGQVIFYAGQNYSEATQTGMVNHIAIGNVGLNGTQENPVNSLGLYAQTITLSGGNAAGFGTQSTASTAVRVQGSLHATGDVTVSGTLTGSTFSGTLTDSINLKGYVVDSFAASLMTATNSADMAGKLGLGGAALLNVGTTAGTVAAGNDSRIVNAVQRDAQGGVILGYSGLQSYGPIVALGEVSYFRIYNNEAGADSAADWTLSCLRGGYLSHDASLRLTALNNLGGPSGQVIFYAGQNYSEATQTGMVNHIAIGNVGLNGTQENPVNSLGLYAQTITLSGGNAAGFGTQSTASTAVRVQGSLQTTGDATVSGTLTTGGGLTVDSASGDNNVNFSRASSPQWTVGTASDDSFVIRNSNSSSYSAVSIGATGTFTVSQSDLNIGTAGYGIRFNNTVRIRTGSGTPEGVVAAPVGSMYLRSDGGAGTTLYIKQSGTGNTGWVGK